MNKELKKLEEFVDRNEAYTKSANWLTAEINKAICVYDTYCKTGVLSEQYHDIDDLLNKMRELDNRAAREEKIYFKLSEEQNNFLK